VGLGISDLMVCSKPDVQVARSATVWELKAAIEDVFFAIYDDPDRAISWYVAALTNNHSIM
jgi:hypothetical protein